MFVSSDSRRGPAGQVDVAFTDRFGGVSQPPYDSLDLRDGGPGREAELEANLAAVARALGAPGLATMRQVHGAEVAVVTGATYSVPRCDGLVTTVAGLALCVRVADCVPVVLADEVHGVLGVAHAGRAGVVAGVVAATLVAMRDLGAERITAWVGPHICGGCYEVPRALRAEVATVSPAAFACTTWGTPALDLGAAVQAQLAAGGCEVVDRSRCTRESDDLFSYRRDGDLSGRLGGLVVLREEVVGHG